MFVRRAEKPSFTSSPVRPFTSLEAAQDYEGVDAFKIQACHFQPKFHFMLLADDDIKPRVSLSKAVKGLVISECRADEHDGIKPVTEGAAELVQEELRFP